MRFKKTPKRIIELNLEEVIVLRNAHMKFRNKCLNLGKPTEDIEGLLIKVTK